MALNEYRPGTAFPGVIGQAFDQSGPAWPQPLRGLAGHAAGRLGRRRDHPIAVIASVIGWLMATALQQRATRHQSGRAPAS
jgi:hypothetical protein